MSPPIPDNLKQEKFLEDELYNDLSNGYISNMRVPEKIVVGQDGGLYEYAAGSAEQYGDDSYDNEPVNEQGNSSEVLEESHNRPNFEVQSMTSMAVDENALRELKQVKRQVQRLSVRIYEIEDELERRKFRDRGSYVLGFLGIASIIASFLYRKNSAKIF
uniref:Miff domain-containing protein n=1 Tax=Rhabditophanes sp. KR3021 TaxID=114890 RepID=A0AC35UHZ5_9BILA